MNFNHVSDIFISISNNILILFTIVFLYAITDYELNINKRLKQIMTGIVIGLIALFLMSNPFEFAEGIIFDTRTILLPLTAFFFGIIPVTIATTIAVLFRLYMGGTGMIIGIFTIVASMVIGILWRIKQRKHQFKNEYLEYYILGMLTNLIAFISFIFLPRNLNVVATVFPVYIIIFPVVTMLIAVIIIQQQKRISMTKLEVAQKLLLQSSIDASHNIEIYMLDPDYNYLTYNIFHESQIKKYYHQNIAIGTNFLSVFKDENQRSRLKSQLERAKLGEQFSVLVELHLDGEKIIEEHYTPVKRGKDIIGITVFIKDVTEQKRFESSILKLSYYDSLTGLPNRRYFQEKLVEYGQMHDKPVSIVTCDVNGLKLFNDTLGHKTGDKVLIEVANLLTKHLDNQGIVARIGGDEFIYLLPNMSHKEGQAFVESLENLFENQLIKGIKIAISYELATKEVGEHIDDALKQSEEAMYQHKLFEHTSHRSEFIKSILNTLREKNPREKEHSNRVAHICIEIGKALDMKKHELALLEAIASLHDIGKIAIDEAILNKPGKLNEEEWKAIKRHPEIGYRIISTAPQYAEIAEDILSHHEHFNGQGYPRGLKGEEIPIRARIVAIADAYDVIVSKRTYKESMLHESAIEEIKRCRGTQFDPHLVDIFIRLIDDGTLNLTKKGH